MKKKVEKGGLFGFLREGKDDTEGSFEFSFAGLFKLMCCTREKPDSSRIASSLEHMSNRLEAMDRFATTKNISQRFIMAKDELVRNCAN